MPRTTPPIPPWIREFAHPGYVNVYSLDRLKTEPKLFCTETLFGDWDAPTLLLAKDAAPAAVIRERVRRGDPDPWRHGTRNRDPMGYQTNERVEEIASHFNGAKLYGSALAHMLKVDDQTSGSLADFSSGPLHDHLKRVLEFVVQHMANLQAIVCLGNEAHRLVSSCPGAGTAAALPVGGSVEVRLFKRTLLVARLYHPARPFPAGWDARRIEWLAVADRVNNRIAQAEHIGQPVDAGEAAMKIYIVTFSEDGSDFNMQIRSSDFTEPNREETRRIAKEEHNADHVWFGDEEPPDRVIQVLQDAAARRRLGPPMDLK